MENLFQLSGHCKYSSEKQSKADCSNTLSDLKQSEERGKRLRQRNGLVGCLIVLALCRSIGAQGANRDRIGVLGVTSETKALIAKMTGTHFETWMGVPFVVGSLKGAPIVAARCGVGKVNAAMSSILMIEHYHPHRILFTGSAGALQPDLAPGDVVIGVKTVQHDVGTLTPKGMEHEATYAFNDRKQNPLFFEADPVLLAAAKRAATVTTLQPFEFDTIKRIPRIVTGIIATGDVFVADQKTNDALRHDLKADAVEEEGAAVAQVCWQQRVPFLAIRSISDNANSQTPVNYLRFYALAAENSARLVTAILTVLKAGSR